MADTEAKVQPSLKEVSLDDIPEISRAGKSSKIVEEFLASGMGAAQVEDGSKHFSASLKRYIKQNEVPVEVVTRGGNTYLRTTDGAEPATPGYEG